jgi:hypothetical protein
VTLKTLLKAKEIYKSGGVHQTYFRTYAVTSTSGATYRVDLGADTCSCPSRTTCSHISAANIHRARRRADFAAGTRRSAAPAA